MDALVALLRTDANAANALGAIASAAAAFLALLVSAISVGISVWAVRSQRTHNELSVRPLAEITVADYENSLRVKLRNNGIGPMIVKAVAVSDGASIKSTVLAWMPTLPCGRPWTHFADVLQDRTLSPTSEIVLLELTATEDDPEFAACRNMVRAALAPLTVTVEYTNIYNSDMPPRVKALSWFGRHRAA